jgi:hypothetical protein
MAYSGARGTLIFEKNMKSKISGQTPFNTPSSLRLLILYFGIITFWKFYISKVLGLVMLHLVTNTLCYATFCRSTETKFIKALIANCCAHRTFRCFELFAQFAQEKV